jgi:periplasmic copper chaperone A
MFGLTKNRMIEIGAALLLTLAALLFVALTVWAETVGLSVADAWAWPTLGEGRNTAAYMTIANTGAEDDVLHSARAEKAQSVELHQTTKTEEGVMRMRKLEGGLAVPAGGSLALEPGGAHLMVLGLEGPLAAGERLTLTLEFAKAGAVEVSVPASQSAPGKAKTNEDHSAHGDGHSHH